MSIPAYMTIEGETQGDISAGALSEDSVGTNAQEAHEDEIIIQALEHSIPRGTNEQNGQITSLPAVKPFKITKAVDKSSPLLHNALVTGEQLTITINWYRVSSAGELEIYYIMELEDAILINIETHLPVAVAMGDSSEMPSTSHTEVLYINPGAITWTHEAGGTEGTYRFGAEAG